MTEETLAMARSGPRDPQPYRMRLPGFLVGEEIGLGAAIGKAGAYVGFRPCGGCVRRRTVLDGWLIFTPRRPT